LAAKKGSAGGRRTKSVRASRTSKAGSKGKGKASKARRTGAAAAKAKTERRTATPPGSGRKATKKATVKTAKKAARTRVAKKKVASKTAKKATSTTRATKATKATKGTKSTKSTKGTKGTKVTKQTTGKNRSGAAKAVVKVPAKKTGQPPAERGPAKKSSAAVKKTTGGRSLQGTVGSVSVAAAVVEAPTKIRRLASRRLHSEAPAPTPAVADIEPYRLKLAEKREDVMARYEQDVRVGMATPQDGMDDLVDRANDAYSRELTFAISDGERRLLELIDEALERIASGAFGYCKSCRRPIAEQRLQAIPWARYCIDCQELEERGLLRE
jgi:DnaK suppressor protein